MVNQPLSPAAAAVLGAYETSYTESGLVAALRTVADQVAPEQPHEDVFEYCCDYSQSREIDRIRHNLLAIADELEGVHD
jgi:hypothetical protein